MKNYWLDRKEEKQIPVGYFYCPYIPIMKTPVVLDPETFIPRKGILTRYGKKLLKDGTKFYSRLSISNFDK